MGAEDVNELTMNYEEDNVQLVKELDKVILSKGAWATLMFRYQQWDKKNETFGEEKYSIRRYQKTNGVYSQRSKFNISSKEQAKKIIETLQEWTKE
ncbi:MAG: hypothetical protein Q7U10_06405 [Thermodesulfovibrionia bacterium]|nr:hypothetical protein [Thermodesulfovibrionia bacterium]